MTSWEVAEKQLEACGVFCHVFLGNVSVHPATYEVCILVEETAYAIAIPQAQTQWQPALTVALLCLLQTDLNESFRQALERHQQVRWTDFERLRQNLATGKFRSHSIALPGAFTPQAPVV